MKNMNNPPEQPARQNNMDMMDVEKLRAQYEAGLSIRQLSIVWHLPYASLYRALKGRKEGQKRGKKMGGSTQNEVSADPKNV